MREHRIALGRRRDGRRVDAMSAAAAAREVTMSEAHERPVTVNLERQGGFRFQVRFDHARMRDLMTDEPPPLGTGAGPSPVQLLGAAVGTCLASSLLHCMERARLEPQSIGADIEMTPVRNENGRLRIGRIAVRLAPTLATDRPERLRRCAELFESFCTVAESVRAGIPVEVLLEPCVAHPIIHEPRPAHVPGQVAQRFGTSEGCGCGGDCTRDALASEVGLGR
jgi:organic hydroperoxide reductase OsmC/OhrA